MHASRPLTTNLAIASITNVVGCLLWMLQAATATLLSGASGCIAIMLCKPKPAFSAVHTISRGTRAAIVASAASCTVVPLWTHILTGPLASVSCGWLQVLLQKRGMHDTTSVVSVHLGGGAIGIVAVGLFAKQVRKISQVPAALSSLSPCWKASVYCMRSLYL